MLSIANVKNSRAAYEYYEKSDDYYTGDRLLSQWAGLGAQYLKLSGEVDADIFAQLLNGNIANQVELHNAANGRRAGTDMTFSAPKSVSMQALIGGDARLIIAHEAAVSKALEIAERHARCRVTENRSTRGQVTGNLVIARFRHEISRDCDPHLHTHCVAINATRRPDGQWRALDNQALYRGKMFFGSIYRAELAREIQTLGYQIQITHNDGRFELAGFTEDHVREFSKRSTSIEKYLIEHKGVTRGEAAAWEKKAVAVMTRDKKKKVDREALHDDWQARSAQLGAQYVLPSASDCLMHVQKEGAREAVDDAIAHISSREAVFNTDDLLRASLELGTGKSNFDEITTEISERIQSGSLIQSASRLTTAEAQELESEILCAEMRGRDQCESVYKMLSTLEPRLIHLSISQQLAAKAILLTRNRVIGIQGKAGTGKTTLLRAVNSSANAMGYRLIGIAPSASAAREITREDIEASTIASFLHRKHNGLDENVVLVVDEAGMVPSSQMKAILDEVEKARCRVVLVGDSKQLKAVEAGKPFSQLQAAGMQTVVVNEIQRQINRNLKQAVEFSSAGQIKCAVDLLAKQIVQEVDATTRFEKIAAAYAGLDPLERSNTRVVAGTRFARGEINQRIREALGFAGTGVEYRLLDRKDLTPSLARMTVSYQVGNLVMAGKDYTSLGIRRGGLAEVVDRRSDAIVLLRQDGEKVEWRPALAPNFTCFIHQSRELAVGDLVRITANLHHLSLVNGDLGTVSSINQDNHCITIKLKDGRLAAMDASRPMTLDYGYCSTVHSSQGQTCDRVLIEADTHSLTANESSFYVAISRARQIALIYTDDREALPTAMSRNFEKTSALEVGIALEAAR